jgi:YebC/PmpR family DNA-binding regulatory protein
MTDNVNRTVGEVRHALTKHGGNLGTSGSVAFQFKKIGVLNFAPGFDEEKLMEAALEAGAEDIQIDEEDSSAEITTSPEEFSAVKSALEAAGFVADNAEVTMRADNLTAIDGDNALKLLKMIDMLEDLDDVQEVFTNADISEEALEAHG